MTLSDRNITDFIKTRLPEIRRMLKRNPPQIKTAKTTTEAHWEDKSKMESQTSRIIRNGKTIEPYIGDVRTSPNNWYRSSPIWRDDQELQYRPGGPVKAYDAAKQADLSLATNCRKYGYKSGWWLCHPNKTSMHLEMHSHRIFGEKRNKSHNHWPQKKTQQVRGGGKTKMLHIQMKVLEPKWNQEQRRSLQNKVNKYTNRSSRTFICCLSLEVKSRFPN